MLFAPNNQWDYAVRARALGGEAALNVILLLCFKIAANNGLLVMEHPPHTVFCRPDLQPRPKIVGDNASLDSREPKRILLSQVRVRAARSKGTTRRRASAIVRRRASSDRLVMMALLISSSARRRSAVRSTLTLRAPISS
jgi:hypothetical protein